MTVANIIFQQLGANRFVAMTGAKDFVASSRSLSFRLPRNAKKITNVSIALDFGKDTYLVNFLNVNGRKAHIKEIARFSDVHVESLKEIFEETTGLRTSL